MPEKIANIAKNTSYFTLALIIQKVISFSYFTLYARYLGPEDLGKYYFAISLTTIFAIFIDLGLANVLTREVAKADRSPQSWLSMTLGLKLPLAALTWLAVFIVAGTNAGLVRQLIYLASVSMVADSFSTLFYACFRGFHNLKYESLASMGTQTVVLLISLAVIKENWGLLALMIGLPTASVLNLIYTLLLAKFRFGLKLRPTWSWPELKILAALAWPFGLYAILQRLYVYLDSVLLFSLSGDRAVGIYQVPFKIVNALQFLPMAFVASLYPALSLYWRHNRQQLMVTFERSLNYSVIIAAPITVGLITLADRTVNLFSTNFQEAVRPLQIVMAALFFIFLHFPLGSLLNACDRQKANTRNMAITLAASVLLNLFLIPKFGVGGASLTVLISNALLFVLTLAVSREIMAWRFAKVLPTAGKTLAAAMIMAGLILFFKERWSFFALVALGAAAYVAALYGLGGFNKADISSIKKSFKQ